MNKKKAIRKFVSTSEEWLQKLKGLDEQSIVLKPSEKEWCIAELYDHVMRVARTYQIPNFRKCISEGVKKGYSKNYVGFVLFDVNYLPHRKMRLESFPAKIADGFTPIIKPKEKLIKEFEEFIEEVKGLEAEIMAADTSKKHRHPFFGWITATEWFRLIDIHIRHHLPQRARILEFISSESKAN